MRTQYIHLPQNNLRIAYSDEGSGPVIVMVHGVAESMLVWKPAIQLLQQNFRCIAIDLPGHGNSWEQRGSFSMSFYVHVLAEFMREKKIGDVVLCGHSMGAQISIITALQHSPVISKLILAAPAGIESFTQEEKAGLIGWSEKAYSQPTPVTQLQFYFRQQLRSQLADAAELAQMQAEQNSPERFQFWRETILGSIEGMLREPVSSFLTSITQKTLLLFGENDQLIPNKYLHPQLTTLTIGKQGEAMIPDCELKMIPDSGHYLPFEKPHDFAEAVKFFLS